MLTEICSMGDKSGNIEAINILAENVKKYRLAAGLSFRSLATLCELSPSQIVRIEKSEINTSVSTIFIIAKALNVKPSQLLEA